MFTRDQEYILCAAIWYKDGKPYHGQPINIDNGFVVSGYRHHSIIGTLGLVFDFYTSKIEHVQGFLTSKNRFVDRVEGMEIARALGQTDSDKAKLFSEDLY